LAYLAVTTLLTQNALVANLCDLMCAVHLPDSRAHALGHILISGASRFGNVQQLQLESANDVWWFPYRTRMGTALASDTVDDH
jgi:hypothetical protein